MNSSKEIDMSNAVIKAHNIFKKYDDSYALDGIDLQGYARSNNGLNWT